MVAGLWWQVSLGDLLATRVPRPRSEEHMSELQSLTNLVCRLLLEKKKKKKYRQTVVYTNIDIVSYKDVRAVTSARRKCLDTKWCEIVRDGNNAPYSTAMQ